MQKTVDLENTVGILKAYSNSEPFIQYLVVNACWKNFVKTNVKNQMFKV